MFFRTIPNSVISFRAAKFLVTVGSLTIQTPAHAALGIQACLENYQASAEKHVREVSEHNERVTHSCSGPSKTIGLKDLPYLKPSHFSHLHGAGHFWKHFAFHASPGDPCYDNTTSEAAYMIGSAVTLGTLPLVHTAVKATYDLTKYLASGVADTVLAGGCATLNCAITAKNLGQAAVNGIATLAKTRKPNPRKLFKDEIELVEDLIRLDENEITLTKPFRKIAFDRAVKKRYPDHRDVYFILQRAFEKNLPCQPNRKPKSLAAIIDQLKTGDLAKAVGYSLIDSVAIANPSLPANEACSSTSPDCRPQQGDSSDPPAYTKI